MQQATLTNTISTKPNTVGKNHAIPSKKKAKSGFWNKSFSFGGVKTAEVLIFTKHLSVALKAGLTLVDGLDMLYQQSEGKMKSMLGQIGEMTKSGQPLHEALALFPKTFTPMYVNLVKAGELSGTLEENLNQLAENLHKLQELKRKVKSAMLYPIIVFTAVIGLGLSVAIFVLPKILPLFKTLDVELPITTKALIFVADLFKDHGIAIGIGAVVGFSALVWLLRRKFIKPFLHRSFLYMPVIKTMVINTNMVRFCRMLGSLLKSGITLDQSLRITVDSTENRIFKKAILSLIPQVEKGENLAAAVGLYPKLFPPLVTRMISMGEQTGSLDKTLEYLGSFYEEEVDTALKNLSTILEPAMLMVIGVAVGTVAISILGPIYQITGNLNK